MDYDVYVMWDGTSFEDVFPKHVAEECKRQFAAWKKGLMTAPPVIETEYIVVDLANAVMVRITPHLTTAKEIQS